MVDGNIKNINKKSFDVVFLLMTQPRFDGIVSLMAMAFLRVLLLAIAKGLLIRGSSWK